MPVPAWHRRDQPQLWRVPLHRTAYPASQLLSTQEILPAERCGRLFQRGLKLLTRDLRAAQPEPIPRITHLFIGTVPRVFEPLLR